MRRINFKRMDSGTKIRILTLFLMLANLISVSIFGFQLLPWTDDEIYENVSIIFAVAASVWASWKDNPVTTESQIEHDHIKRMKGVKK